MKKTIAITLAGIMIFASTAIYAADQQQYADLKATNWAYEPVKTMSEKEIIKGYPNGTFRPQNEVTYAEFIKMIVVASTEENVIPAKKPNHWAYNFYQKGLELGLYNESDIEMHMLDNPIPRKYMALIISQALGKTEINDYSKIEKMVNDVDSTTEYDYHIIKSYATGILSGYNDGSFKPNGTLSRAESAVVLYRYTDESKRTPIKINEEKVVDGVEIKIENSYNKDLTWIQCGPLSDILTEEGIKQLKKVAINDNLNSYVMVKYDESFGFELGSGGGYSWIKMNDYKYYDKYSEAHLIENKEVSKHETSSNSYKNGTLYVGITNLKYVKEMDYIALTATSDNVVTLVINPYK